MNLKRRHLGCICLVALTSIWAINLSACSLITDFSPEGKPCDSYQKCEDGYYCKLSNEETGEGTCEPTSDQPSAILPFGAADDAANFPERMSPEATSPSSSDAFETEVNSKDIAQDDDASDESIAEETMDSDDDSSTDTAE